MQKGPFRNALDADPAKRGRFERIWIRNNALFVQYLRYRYRYLTEQYRISLQNLVTR
jgi:hypothetical protein